MFVFLMLSKNYNHSACVEISNLSENMANVYFLVKWVEEEDSWDVLPVKSCVIQPVDPDSLVGKVADFYWKKGEESAPCSVLAFGKKNEMEKECSKLIKPPTLPENDESFKKLGVGMRTVRKPFRLDDPSDEEESAQVPKKKKQKVAPTETSKNILKEVEKRQTACTSTPKIPATLEEECQCRKYNHLLMKYTNLKQKHKELKNEVSELQIYKDLHKIVEDLTTYKNEVIKASAGSYVSSDQEVEQSGTSTSPAQKEKIKQMTKVDIGHSIVMEKAKLMAITQVSDGPTKLARNLFVALFPFEEVVGKSITGRKSNAHNYSVEKEKLDPNRISAIIDFTIKKYPSTPTSLLRQSLSNKVKEINKTEHKE